MKYDALIEAIKELARAVDALNVTLEQLQPRRHYPCIVCGREDVPGVLSSDGFTCEDCFVPALGVAGSDVFAYTRGTCGEKGKGGVDFGVGGFCCDECLKKRSEKPERTTVDPGKTSGEKRGHR